MRRDCALVVEYHTHSRLSFFSWLARMMLRLQAMLTVETHVRAHYLLWDSPSQNGHTKMEKVVFYTTTGT